MQSTATFIHLFVYLALFGFIQIDLGIPKLYLAGQIHHHQRDSQPCSKPVSQHAWPSFPQNTEIPIEEVKCKFLLSYLLFLQIGHESVPTCDGRCAHRLQVKTWRSNKAAAFRFIFCAERTIPPPAIHFCIHKLHRR